MGTFSAQLPFPAAGLVIRILHRLPTCFNDQTAAAAECILRLIPLQLMVADKAMLIGPMVRIGAAVMREIIMPDQMVAVGRVDFFRVATYQRHI